MYNPFKKHRICRIDTLGNYLNISYIYIYSKRMNTEYDISNLPNNIQDKLVAYDRIRETQRKYSKAYIAKISDTDEYMKKQPLKTGQ